MKILSLDFEKWKHNKVGVKIVRHPLTFRFTARVFEFGISLFLYVRRSKPEPLDWFGWKD